MQTLNGRRLVFPSQIMLGMRLVTTFFPNGVPRTVHQVSSCDELDDGRWSIGFKGGGSIVCVDDEQWCLASEVDAATAGVSFVQNEHAETGKSMAPEQETVLH